MDERFRKTISIPDVRGSSPRAGQDRLKSKAAFALAGQNGDDGARDVSKPVAYDEQGRPLYAPRGTTVRLG